MFGRRSKTALLEKTANDAGSKAAETVADLAEKAVAAAREAQRTAAPVIRKTALNSAETLSHAAGKAAVVLSDTADKLATSGSEAAGEAGFIARHRLADASEKLAEAVRPKKKRRLRKLLFAGAIAGGLYVLLTKTPLKNKLADLAFGPPIEDEEEPEPITLPVTSAENDGAPAASSTTAKENGEGVGTAAPKGESKA
jgi:hypothetical protein